MRPSKVFIHLMLMAAVLLASPKFCIAQPHLHKHHVHHLAGRDLITITDVTTITAEPTPLPTEPSVSLASVATPCFSESCIAPSDPPACAAANGSSYTQVPQMEKYTLICDTDFPAQNIYPFVSAGSFEECLLQCESFNEKSQDSHCAGFVFAPEREHDSDDCYLKSSLNEPGPATIHLIGATLVSAASTPTVTATLTVTSFASPATDPENAQSPTDLPPFHTPKVSGILVLGTSTNSPTSQYVSHPMAVPEKLKSNQMVPGINMDLTTQYNIAPDTGSWTSSMSGLYPLVKLSVVPHLSRDGGKGGIVDGAHIFVFCDTASFTKTEGMVGFVSSSVATDSGMFGLDGKALTLADQIGEWQDNVGRMRGFSPMTAGEEAFNIALSGNGSRYAVWPESSPIPLNHTHSLIYASLVYDEVDMSNQVANFTTLGNTLLLVSIDPEFGPGASRVVKWLFQQNEVAWGSLGGLRAWGQSGVGGMDGSVYVFGQVEGGVLVARTTPAGIADRSTYSYWIGSSWSSGMPPPDSTSYFLDTPVMDLDVFYSPYHKTFIMVYLTPDADNTFYFRYLKSAAGILPPYEGGSPDYAEDIIMKDWSDQQVLYAAPSPPMGFIYAGGVHGGYFGTDDITLGGRKMLLSWTQHTGQDAASTSSGYAHMTVVITFA